MTRREVVKKERLRVKCPSCNQWYLEDEYVKALCPNCGVRNPIFTNPKEDECGYCHAYIRPQDIFCRYCGTKIGEKFEPYINISDCLYGPPPIEVEHECKYCGNRWTSGSASWRDNENYCPSCGKKE